MSTMLQDARYGVRMLRKRPGFTVVAVITLGLGIGANTAIFSVINAILLRPLPYPAAERLITVRQNQSLLNLEDIKAQTQSFETAGGVTLQALDYTGGSEPVQVQAALVTHEVFDLLGVQTTVGRTISPEEDRFDGERLVVLSHGFWQRQFGGDAGVVGQTIPLSGNSYTVIGVAAPGAELPHASPEVWAALRVVNPVAAGFRGVQFLRTFWRLKPGVSLGQAQAEFAAIDQNLEQQYPALNKGRRSRLMSVYERMVGDTRPALLVLFGAVGLVLLIACANFANLLLARAASRQREIAVRAALGASRIQLIRQMLTESMLLALVGGAVGLALALWGIDLLLALKPDNLPRLSGVGVDRWVLVFTLGVSLLTGFVFGLLPALGASRANLSETLKEGGRAATAGVGRQRLRNLLVVSEMALALMLLVGAGLLIKGFLLLRAVEPGFKPAGVLSMRIELPEARYREIPSQADFRRRMLEAVGSLPGAEAAIVSEIPLGGDWLHHNFIIDGRPPVAPGDEPELFSRSTGGDYFRAMSIPLLRGRDFTTQDDATAPAVGIINESMARQYFPNDDPIGARIRWAGQNPPRWITIVGVVGDVKHFGLDQPEEPAAYTPYAQSDQPWKRWMFLLVRSASDPSSLTASVKKQIWTVDNQIAVTKVRPLSEVMATSIAKQRFNMLLLSIFAAVALVLASVGIYGVISYSVAQRTHEIGVRMALGARPRDILALVLGQGLLLAAIAVVIGVGGGLALTSVMSSLLFGVSATDPATFVIVSLVLTGIALLASFIPARRAMKVDPMIALRYE